MSEMRRVGLTLAIAVPAAIAGSVAAHASPSTSGRAPDTGRVVVMVATPELPSGNGAAARSRWRELRSRSRELLDGVAARNGLAVETAIPEIGLLSVDLGPGGLPALRARLAEEPGVESVRPDVPVELRYAPNDPAFSAADTHAPSNDVVQWNLIREGGPGAWDLSKGSGAEVAMVDSGVDGGHPDLGPRIVGGQTFGTASGATTDQDGHGTHTAGLACGSADDGYGIASLGFHCDLFIAKILINGSCSNVSNAIVAAANRNSDVINMSLGGCDSALVAALDYAQSRGSVLVVAANNVPNPDGACGGIFDPHNCIYPEEWAQPLGTGPNAGFDRGLVVTSSKYDGTRSSFAEGTTRVSVAAYGSASNSIGGQQGIFSTWPANTTTFDTGVTGLFGPCACRTTFNGDNRFAYLTGTSMATPQVAGVAALIRSVKPTMANTQVVHLIKASASQCGSYANGLGWGVIRADEAVIGALDRDVDPPSSNVRKAKRVRRRSVASTARAKGRPVRIRVKSDDVRQPHCVNHKPASGVKKVVVFASRNDGPFRRIGKTKTGKLTFRPKRHGRFSFYSIAVDNEGNREAVPTAADLRRKL